METSKFGEKIMKKIGTRLKLTGRLYIVTKVVQRTRKQCFRNCTLKIRYLLGFTYIASDHFRFFFYVSHISNEILSFENKYLVEKGNS